MFSTDDGQTWQSLKLNLPTVAVHDLVVKGDDLVVGTHGRSIWILDDLQPVREIDAPRCSATTVHLFPVADAVRWRIGDGSWAAAYGRYPNPPHGASIYYFLKDKPKGELKIEILDAENRVVRTLSSVPREPDHSSENDDPEDLKKAALPVETRACSARSGTSPGRARARSRAARSTPAIRPKDRGRCPAPTPCGSPSTAQTQTAPLQGRRRSARQRTRRPISKRSSPSRCASATTSRSSPTLVNQLRSVQEQLQARAKALERSAKPSAGIADLLEGVDGGDQEGGCARGQAAQPDRRGRLRHPGDARRHAALLAAVAAADVGGRGRRRRRPPA